ncbi:MAG TPA: glycoside hydrolase family 3 N-terminal domain-containing protein, partial [Verrucomicrobiae bacterium]|nr:glycoside hydrolase family 3 N-terminal domain-containing protein [Verrucomicrobiae bacterium]
MNTKPPVRLLLFLIGIFPGIVAADNVDHLNHGTWLDLDKNGIKDVYEDPSQPTDRRVADLLQRMTLVEKLGQLHLGLIQATNSADAARHGKVGAFLAYSNPDDYAVTGRELQQIAMNESRLGIPLMFGFDAIHGCRTMFPIPLAMSCSWEPSLIERVQAASAMECREIGINWTFSPMVDLSRDPRWGRISEGFGEDPYLDSQFAAAAVRGFQGDAEHPSIA